MNKILSQTIRFIDNFSKPSVALAHCDIPCGVYETDTIKHAAETIIKMCEKIAVLNPHSPNVSLEQKKQIISDIGRMTEIKEKYSQICKDQLLILWTDYFKAEHLSKFPELHSTFWNAAKQCSVAKRTIELKAAKDLQESVNKIADMFAHSK